jgi:putative cell wall-binding protein
MLDYPVLLSTSAELNYYAEEALSALSRNSQDFQVIIIGGEPSVSPAVEEALIQRFGAGGVVRLAGPNRYATALEVLYFGSLFGQWSDTVIIASGTGFADALSVAPYAAHTRTPIILSDGLSLTEAARAEIAAGGFKRAVIVGGEPSISLDVQNQLAEILAADKIVRLAGPNRYATSLAIANWELSEGMGADGVAVALGENFPDALAGGVLLGRTGAVVLLASPANISSLQLLSEHAGEINLLRFFGSEASVTLEMRIAATDALGWPGQVLQ